MPFRAVVLVALSLAVALATARRTSAQTPSVTWSGENQRLRTASVTGSGTSYTITATVENDNANGSLPSSFRRWWHFEIGNLGLAATTTLAMRITNAGYSDVILPVWSLSTDGGQSFGRYVRVPTTAVPTVSGSTHRFTLQVPAGVTNLRLAKYFPYTVTDKDALLNRIRNHPSGHVRSIQSLGSSWQGRPIERIELTDGSVPDTGKKRVWIHSGIHPSETTSYFVVAGLVDWLLSGNARAELLLDELIFDIVPMANPDGVFLGNYRTNSRSVNLENEWVAPYRSNEREIVALRNHIESLMGTPTSPAANPIEVLLNLHSSHNVAYPFHFEHVANPNFDLNTSRSGVIPAVNQLERQWIAAFRAQSVFVNRGTTASSTVGAPTRPFVESMMHDRWSIDPRWTGAPNLRSEVMAITFEGTYGRGPNGVSWNTDQDYVTVGTELGLALGSYFGLLPGGRVESFGTPCSGPSLVGNLLPNPDRFSVTALGGAANAPAWFVIGSQIQNLPLPPPTLCPLRTNPLILLTASTNGIGIYSATIPIPAQLTALRFKCQLIVADTSSNPARWQSTNGLDVVFVR